MLTQKDIEEIEKLIKKEIKHLPTKDEFYQKMDEIMGELRAIRDEQEIVTGKQSLHSDQLEDHEIRINQLEKTTHP